MATTRFGVTGPMTPYAGFAPKAPSGAVASTTGYAAWQSAVMTSGWLLWLIWHR